MGGLYRIFLKLTPIMLLICCICFGIYHTFQQENKPNITYLSTEQVNIGTNENPEYKTLYKFDMVSYTQNINQNILKRSVNKTFDLSAYQNTLNRFNTIWEDGYQVGDVLQTIANIGLLIVNTLILPINIILVPIRIIAGLILTGLSLIGININTCLTKKDGQYIYIIIPFLTFLTDQLSIPMINPAHTKQTAESIKGKTFQIQNNMQLCYYGTSHTGGVQYYTDYDMHFNFTSADSGQYRRLFTSKDITYSAYNLVQESRVRIWYEDTEGYQILVYDSSNGGWLYNGSKTITINNNLDTSNEDLMNHLLYFINAYTTEI